MRPQQVAVIGPGRVGTTLALGLARAGHRIVAVAGGHDDSRRRFRAVVPGSPDDSGGDPAVAARRGSLVVIATPDDAIEPVVRAIAVAEGFHEGQHVVHVSGAQGLRPLRPAQLAGARVAACHPAQTFPAADPDALTGAAWAVTAGPEDRGWAHELVEQLGGVPHDLREQDRTLYHAALVVGANAVGAAVAVARRLLLATGIDDPAAFLAPLVRASVANVLTRGSEALTGPVARGDTGTVAAHLAHLDADLPELATAYRHLTAVILGVLRPSLPADRATVLEQLVREEP